MVTNKYEFLYVKYKGAIGKEVERLMQLEEEKKLTEGVFYKVDYINMGHYSTRVKLQNFDKTLNSDPFGFYTIKGNYVQEINIYADPRYNPYLELEK